VAAWKEERREENVGENKGKKRKEEIYSNGMCRKKTDRGDSTFSPYPFDSNFRSPLTFS
jgi:hypothetical protein